MKKTIITSLFIVFFYCSIAQDNFIYLNNNKYPATEQMKFSGDYVEFAINNKAGLLRLVVGIHGMRGPIRIFLEDGNFIHCNDYGYKEDLGNSVANIYKLTEKEMDYLCKMNINKIRFTNTFGNHYIYSNYNGKNRYTKIIKTAEIIRELRKKYNNESLNYDYNALFGEATKNTTSESITYIRLKPNHIEAGRKYGDRREPTMTGKINTMTIIFSRNSVIIRDNVEDVPFKIVGYEWIDANKLWIDFSTKPLEFYMVIVFDIDGLVFVNNENDTQPGEEYKSLYFKELDISKFKMVYH